MTSGPIRESRALFVPFVQDKRNALFPLLIVVALYTPSTYRKKGKRTFFHKRRPTHLFRKIQVVEAFHNVHELVDGPRQGGGHGTRNPHREADRDRHQQHHHDASDNHNASDL